MQTLRFVIERHADGFVAYPLGLRWVVVGEGDTQEAALADAQSATRFHLDTFGDQALLDEAMPLGAVVVEAGIAD
ncbi:MAG: hypothetical protein ACRCT8_06880 [Lacipirellulaceae bacterium]